MNIEDWAIGITPGGLEEVQAPDSQRPSVSIPVRTGFHNARGYRHVKTEYSCIPDSQYPWNPEIIKKIWEFAPDVTPLWVRDIYRGQDNKDVVFGRHGLGRYVANRVEFIPFRVEMPTMPCQGISFNKPNMIWFIHQGADINPEFRDLPGAYLPFDEGLLYKAKYSWGGNYTEKEYKALLRKELIEDPLEEARKRKQAQDDDMAYRNRDFARYAAKVLESLSDVETLELLRAQASNRRPN